MKKKPISDKNLFRIDIEAFSSSGNSLADFREWHLEVM